MMDAVYEESNGGTGQGVGKPQGPVQQQEAAHRGALTIQRPGSKGRELMTAVY